MSKSNYSRFIFPPDVKELAHRVIADLNALGYVVERIAKDGPLRGKERMGAKLLLKHPGKTEGIVVIPTGTARHTDATLSSAGVTVIAYDEPMAKKVAKALDQCGYSVRVRDGEGPIAWHSTVVVSDATWDTAPRERADRANSRQRQARQNLKAALFVLGETESDEEKAALAQAIVTHYGLTIDKTLGIIGGETDSVDRAQLIIAMPTLQPYLVEGSTKTWRERIASAVNTPDDDLLRLISSQGVDERGFEYQALSRIAGTTSTARAKAALTAAGGALLATKADKSEDAIRQAAEILKEASHEKLVITEASRPTRGRRRRGRGNLSQVGTLLVKFLSYGDPERLKDELDEVLANGSIGTVQELLTEALLNGYRNAALRTLGVLAWSHLGWKQEVQEKDIGKVALNEIFSWLYEMV